MPRAKSQMAIGAADARAPAGNASLQFRTDRKLRATILPASKKVAISIIVATPSLTN